LALWLSRILQDRNGDKVWFGLGECSRLLRSFLQERYYCQDSGSLRIVCNLWIDSRQSLKNIKVDFELICWEYHSFQFDSKYSKFCYLLILLLWSFLEEFWIPVYFIAAHKQRLWCQTPLFYWFHCSLQSVFQVLYQFQVWSLHGKGHYRRFQIKDLPASLFKIDTLAKRIKEPESLGNHKIKQKAFSKNCKKIPLLAQAGQYTHHKGLCSTLNTPHHIK